jgi:DNA (cytosine-5)-methyltransferase 1
MTIGRTCVSLFSGAGGLDLGLEQAGWQTIYASDNDPLAVASLLANAGRLIVASGRTAFQSTLIECVDVRTLDADAILARSGVPRGGVELLAGGPPCQSWSSAGHQLGFDDPRGRLFEDFIRIAQALDARWLLLENVRGLLTARGADGRPGSALGHIRQALLQAGFQTTVTLLNAADYGVPQRRVRLFMIGFRAGDPPPFPTPTHSREPDASTLPWVSLGCALASVENLSEDEIMRPNGKLASELASLPVGTGLKSPGKVERTRPGGHWGYKQGAFVADTAVSARTVTANSQQDWVRDLKHGIRRLCPRECAVVQGFPLGWRFEGPISAQYRLIGNAVPPPLARAIGESLITHADAAPSLDAPDANGLLPLPERLLYHVRYTAREEASNGESRRDGPRRRVPRLAIANVRA